MAKKARKPFGERDLAADYERLMQLGALPTSTPTTTAVTRMNRVQQTVVVRDFTTYSAYEDPLIAE